MEMTRIFQVTKGERVMLGEVRIDLAHVLLRALELDESWQGAFYHEKIPTRKKMADENSNTAPLQSSGGTVVTPGKGGSGATKDESKGGSKNTGGHARKADRRRSKKQPAAK